jgi:hypothetical protein
LHRIFVIGLTIVTRVSSPDAVLWLHRSKLLRLSGRALCGLFCAAFIFPPTAATQQVKPGEYQVKAVYLYNFGRFIEWPPSVTNAQVFTICVMGQDPFGTTLDTTLAGETINNRKLVAKRISTSRDAAGCHILFISSSEASRIKDILNSVEKSASLTVSDMPGFTNSGGMIQFVLRDNKVRFEVNLGPAAKAGLNFSSQLLKVATDVRNEPHHEDVNR